MLEFKETVESYLKRIEAEIGELGLDYGDYQTDRAMTKIKEFINKIRELLEK